MLAKHELSRLPGLPPLTSSPCLYEERLLQQPRLLVESSQPGLLVEVAGADFKRLLSKASAGNFAVPLSDIRPNLDRPHDDRAEITQAVQASLRGASRSVWKKPSRSRRCRMRRKRSSSCESTRKPPSTTSPAWWKPTRHWRRR